ncbi:GtrA family protein [Tamaricihabitans halophyticus]|uniref:GtrA family protein n=1 Tax=Tamaricihabitans halophyticus TaxID=1262583 RepID=UPI001046B57D
MASGTETSDTESAGESSKQLGFFAQVIRFGLIGGFCGLIDLGIYSGLRALGMDIAPWEDVARAISFIVGTTTAYFLNKRFTFSATVTGEAKQPLGFALLYATTFLFAVGVNRLSLQLLPEMDWKSTVAWVISQGTATVINFVMLRTVVYRKPKATTAER